MYIVFFYWENNLSPLPSCPPFSVLTWLLPSLPFFCHPAQGESTVRDWCLSHTSWDDRWVSQPSFMTQNRLPASPLRHPCFSIFWHTLRLRLWFLLRWYLAPAFSSSLRDHLFISITYCVEFTCGSVVNFTSYHLQLVLFRVCSHISCVISWDKKGRLVDSGAKTLLTWG